MSHPLLGAVGVVAITIDIKEVTIS